MTKICGAQAQGLVSHFQACVAAIVSEVLVQSRARVPCLLERPRTHCGAI